MVNLNFLFSAIQPALNIFHPTTTTTATGLAAHATNLGIPKPIVDYGQKFFGQGAQNADISSIIDLGQKVISGFGDVDFSRAQDFALKAVNLVQTNTKQDAVRADNSLWNVMFDGLKSTWGYAETHPIQSFMLSTLLSSKVSLPQLWSMFSAVAGPMGGMVGTFVNMWQSAFGNAMTGKILSIVQSLGREMHQRGVPVHAALLLALVVAGVAVSSVDPQVLDSLKKMMSKGFQHWRNEL